MILQLTPKFPPDISGVGDYAATLQSAIQARGHSLETLVLRHMEPPGSTLVGAEEAQDKVEVLQSALAGAETVFLQFSGYGYARRGLCGWLVDCLKEWKGEKSGKRLVTMFHEVYATGPLWRSSFWTAPMQRRIASRLGVLSDACFVSSHGGRRQLMQLSRNSDVKLMPIFSTIGEPAGNKSLQQRDQCAVVFGGLHKRQAVYRCLFKCESILAKAMRRIGVKEILDIGPNLSLPAELAGCPIHAMGALGSKQVSESLQRSRVGFIHYPEHVLSKSSIAAAYFAHGLLAVNTGGQSKGIVERDTEACLLKLHTFICEDIDAQAVADKGRERYRSHDIDTTVDIFCAKLT